MAQPRDAESDFAGRLPARSGLGREGPRRCSIHGCPKATREGKPYCLDHVEKNPHIVELLATLRQREQEADQLDQGHEGNPNGHLASEVVTRMADEMGCVPLTRIGTYVKLSDHGIESLVRALDRNGRVVALRDGNKLMVCLFSPRASSMLMPVEVQFSDRSWVIMVPAAHVGSKLAPIAPGPLLGRSDEQYASVRPFTRGLRQHQARRVLVLLQEHRADKIEDDFWTRDEVHRKAVQAELRLHGFYPR